MPVSSPENKDIAKKWIDSINPMRVLDVGAGNGTYSDLAKQPEQHWTALEVFYPYVKTFGLNHKYNRVIIGDARYVDYNKAGNYWDLIIAADVLEHMTKEESKLLIRELMRHCKNLLICFPVLHLDQHAGEEGNDFETHVDHWGYTEMKEFLYPRWFQSTEGKVLAYFLVKGNRL